MDGLCITDAVKLFGVTSKTLRYYERVGLLDAKRAENNNYRYYEESEVERIRQIMILRKMQIPIKDIIRIYENEDMSAVVEVFVSRIESIDEEVEALTELRRITNDFLQTMLENGVTKISALPILYERMEKRLDTLERGKGKNMSYSELSALSERLAKPVEPIIISLPPMRVISSMRKDGNQSRSVNGSAAAVATVAATAAAAEDATDAVAAAIDAAADIAAATIATVATADDTDGFWRWAQSKGLTRGEPGLHDRFEYENDDREVTILRVDDDFVNDGDYLDYTFQGGLYASTNVYLDEDLGERLRTLIKEFDGNKYYQIDYRNDGSLRHPVMLENLISPDDRRELAALLVPVKKRMADPALFDKPEEAAGITVAEIQAANPILWEADVPLDKLTQSHAKNSYLRINEDGEAEFIGWILRAVLNTNVSVKLPFRVDIEFRMSGSGKTGVAIYHSEDTGYALGRIGNRGFGVNIGNGNERMVQAVRFAQPIFWDDYNFPGRGAINIGEPNRLTWIVGAKHLAVILNGEIRYCGVGFPYMALDLGREEVCPIVIGASGGNDKIYFRSIRVSQLAETKKSKIRKGELTVITKQSNNIIPVIHRLVTDEYGENYWFNGCAKYVMECLGEPDYDYWFFAGLTGDLFTQHYAYDRSYWDAIDGYRFEEDSKGFVRDVFAKCGYAATFVSRQEIADNTEMYLQTLVAYIDKGVPVINWEAPCGVFVGYEEYGKILLCITGNKNQPERIPLEQVLQSKGFTGTVGVSSGGGGCDSGWIFVGEKKESRPLAQMYRDAIAAIPQHFSVKTDAYCFGAEAFRAWAKSIEDGKFDTMSPEDFDTWFHYTNYVCVLATNGSCCHGFLQKARELNPDMTFLQEVSDLYKKIGRMWNSDSDNLEALGGGFNVTLEVLRDKDRRLKIASKIRDFAVVTDEISRIIKDNMKL